MSRRGENIYKRKDGRWEGRYIKRRDAHGKAVYGYIYSKSYTELKEKLIKIRNRIECSNFNESNFKFEEIALQWLETVHKSYKKSTYAKYRNIIFKHLAPEFRNYCVSQITTESVWNFCYIKETAVGLSPKSVKDILSVLKQIIKFTKKFGSDCKCDFDCISIKSDKTTVNALTLKQTKSIVNYLIGNINYVNLGILITFYTGIRIGELCALKFDDLHTETNTVSINKTMQRIQNFKKIANKTDVIISSPKTESSIREIPIPQFITDIIIDNGLYKNNAFILTGDCSKFIEPRTLENKFNKIADICDVHDASFHMIRHTFATNCIEVGVDVKSLSEILGHSNVSITLNRYVHSTMQTKKKNMEKLYMSFSA